MVAPADHPRRVLHYQAALVRDGDGFTARCLELGWLCATGRDFEEAIARLRDLVEMELSHHAGPWPLHAIVVPSTYQRPSKRRDRTGQEGGRYRPLPCENKHGRPATSGDASIGPLTLASSVVACRLLPAGCRAFAARLPPADRVARGVRHGTWVMTHWHDRPHAEWPGERPRPHGHG
jgi:hypothetical protein